jgi:hypothetical protein
MINNAYYEVLPSQGVYEVLPPEDNLQDSARSCCASCTEVTRCNAFQWCVASPPSSSCCNAAHARTHAHSNSSGGCQPAGQPTASPGSIVADRPELRCAACSAIHLHAPPAPPVPQ